MASRVSALCSARPCEIAVRERGLWSVPRCHIGETIVCIGSGPSLRGIDPADLAGLAVIACNSAAKWATDIAGAAIYALTYGWRHVPLIAGLSGQLTEMVTINSRVRAGLGARCRMLEAGDRRGLSLDRSHLAHGSCCGHGAINLAYLLGAARIVLVGYDMRADVTGTHWDTPADDRARIYRDTDTEVFNDLAGALETRGITVVNATPGSALNAFARMDLVEALLEPYPS